MAFELPLDLRHGMRRVGPVAVVAAAVALRGVLALRGAAHVHDFTHDTAYYYAAAHGIARHLDFHDWMVWTFLGAPHAVNRALGDYWSVGWPLVLAAFMKVGGSTVNDAARITATLSMLAPIAVYAACRACRLRAWTAAGAALVLAALTRLKLTDCLPDVSLMYRLVAVAALAAYAAPRWASGNRRAFWAGALAASLAWFRGEGAMLFVVVVAVALLVRAGLLRGPELPLGRLLLGGLVVLLLLVGYNVVAFGRVQPLPRSLIPWMRSYPELYRYPAHVSRALWWAQGTHKLLALRKQVLSYQVSALAKGLPWPLLAFAALGAVAAIAQRDARGVAFVGYGLACWLGVVLVAPIVSSADRFVLNVTPLLVVLAACGWSVMLRGAGALLGFFKRPWKRLGPALAQALLPVWVVGSVACYWPRRLRWTGFDEAYARPFEQGPSYADPGLRTRLGLTAQDVVLTCDPWRIAAMLRVRAVMCPWNGRAATTAVMLRYRPDFVVIVSDSRLRGFAPTSRNIHLERRLTTAGATWYRVRYSGALGSPG